MTALTMQKKEFLETYQTLLSQLNTDRANIDSWVLLARHIDGRSLNFEECLASTEELKELDTQKIVLWKSYIWEHVHHLAPENIEALEMLSEYYVDVLDDLESAAPLVQSLCELAPENPIGLHYDVLIALAHDDKERARTSMIRLCEQNPAKMVWLGTVDLFDDGIEFLAPVASVVLKALESTKEPTQYHRTLQFKIASLAKGAAGLQTIKNLELKTQPSSSIKTQALDSLELSFSAQRFFAACHIRTVGDLLGLPLDGMQKVHNNVIIEVKRRLQEAGVDFIYPVDK